MIIVYDESIILNRFRALVDREKTRDGIAKKMTEQGLNCKISTINKHYNGDRKISTEYVIKYAKYFGVSTDYLLGLSNVSTTETDIRMINEYTGLSELAIDTLNKHNQISKLESGVLKNSNTDIMNFLIENIGNSEFIFSNLRVLANESFEDNSDILDEKTSLELEKFFHNGGTFLSGYRYRAYIQLYLEKKFSHLIKDFCTEFNRQEYDFRDYKLLDIDANILNDWLEILKKNKAQKSGDVSNGNNQKEKG